MAGKLGLARENMGVFLLRQLGAPAKGAVECDLAVLYLIPILRYGNGPGETSGMPLGFSGPPWLMGVRAGVESTVGSKKRG